MVNSRYKIRLKINKLSQNNLYNGNNSVKFGMWEGRDKIIGKVTLSINDLQLCLGRNYLSHLAITHWKVLEWCKTRARVTHLHLSLLVHKHHNHKLQQVFLLSYLITDL